MCPAAPSPLLIFLSFSFYLLHSFYGASTSSKFETVCAKVVPSLMSLKGKLCESLGKSVVVM